MMHEINVIRGPGGCFSLFVNVPHAENMPRAVSTGLQNYQKALLLNLLEREMHTHFHLREPSPHWNSTFSFLPFHLVVYFSPSWPALDNGMPFQDEYISPTTLNTSNLPSEHLSCSEWGSIICLLSWLRFYFVGKKRMIAARAIKVARNKCMSYLSPDSARALVQCVSFSDGN